MRRTRILRMSAVAAGAFALVLSGCGSGDTQTDARDDAGGAAPDGEPGSVVLYSTQFNPVEEADAIRRDVLASFTGDAEFVGASGDGEFIDRVSAEAQAGRGEIGLLGALHGTYVDLQDQGLLTDLSDLVDEMADLGIPDDVLELGRLGTDQQWYIPWVQASYVVAADKQALEYLPDGADVESLTYDEYLQWAANTAEGTGAPRFGFPAGEEGLMHRFLQGYLLPSFTGGVVRTFGDNAAWEYLAELWEYVHPQSLTYEFMEDPLLSGEVLVAWDHVARLKNALDSRPDDFVVVPVPSGPAGRAHMPVVAGLAVPESSPDPDAAKDLIRHLLSVDSQLATLSAVAFYPVVETGDAGDLEPGIQLAADAVESQANADDALLVLLPLGLGEQGGTFNDIYRSAFERVAVSGEDPSDAVGTEAARLEDMMENTGAPCWSPDEPSDGPCPVGN
ncbi:extracellular solute-binding protein [Phytoactinopolyspora mesophila]|uniref:Extracellular solute-binding protein n=1 Tax=Phytoactinopolyspora mesophila TaxID=2650750 RepID=A0A7K3M5H6_9ACTN|nr:ABC transporter substrate-binding protein [Phytoactinopolyspora mesophila]NDL57688.1 extracellular solute-binding protein [Phytoactinopolyspora mesophila]